MVGPSPAGRSYLIFDEVCTLLCNEPSGPLHTEIIGCPFTDTDLEWIEFINRRLNDTPEQQERKLGKRIFTRSNPLGIQGWRTLIKTPIISSSVPPPEYREGGKGDGRSAQKLTMVPVGSAQPAIVMA